MPKKTQEIYKVIATEGNGGIKLIVKNNIYYLKFPSHIYRALWKQPQKLLSLGIKSTDADSLAQAKAIWERACEDAKSKTGYETLKDNYPHYNQKSYFKLIGDDREKCPGLYEICREWYDQKKIKSTRLEETTKMAYEDSLKMLQNCPQDLFEMDFQPNDYIIEPHFKGLERTTFTRDFAMSWCGVSLVKSNYHKVGLMEKLLDEGKLSQPIYRSPYATRHTFITRQINAGLPIGTVAAWVGDDPATIAKHYLGADSTRVPLRPSTTQMRPASNATSGTPIDPTTKPENTSSESSKVEALEKLCAELLKRLDKMEQSMINPVS
jgi:hypothetical protein